MQIKLLMRFQLNFIHTSDLISSVKLFTEHLAQQLKFANHCMQCYIDAYVISNAYTYTRKETCLIDTFRPTLRADSQSLMK